MTEEESRKVLGSRKLSLAQRIFLFNIFIYSIPKCYASTDIFIVPRKPFEILYEV